MIVTSHQDVLIRIDFKTTRIISENAKVTRPVGKTGECNYG